MLRCEIIIKTKVENHPYIYPKPIVLVGAIVEGKPNFFAVADINSSEYNPPKILVSSGKNHFTNKGIIKNESFSVNIPSEDMVKITDYCGITEGKRKDKSELFEIFYGVIKTAPLIKEAPVNMACKLIKTIDLGGTNYIFIGEVVDCYINEDCLIDNKPNIKKINPIVYSTYDMKYWRIGDYIGRAFKIGREYK